MTLMMQALARGLEDAPVARTHRVRIGAALVATYIAAYLALDWVSFINALHGIGITPWDPSSGLTLAFLIAKGVRYAPAVALAELLSSECLALVPVPLPAALGGALVVSGGYALAAFILRQLLSDAPPNMNRAQDVAALIAVAVFAAGIIALGYVAIYGTYGLVPWVGFAEAVFQYWIGDVIGIVVLAPLLLLYANGPSRFSWSLTDRRRIVEIVVQGLGIAAALAVVVGPDYDHEPARRFYLLFLPVIWIATRHGIVGATWAALFIQSGLIALLEIRDQPAAMALIFSYQMLMFALAATGLMLGAVVTERQRARHALSEAKSRLGVILNTASDAVLTVDDHGRIESVNAAAERQFGKSADALIGCNVRDLLVAPNAIEQFAGIADPTSGQGATREFAARRADGSTFPAELTVGRYEIDGNWQYTLVVRDIAARREADRRAREHQAELAYFSRLSTAGEMASALAHEMNQPLTAIVAYARGCLRLLRAPRPEPDMLHEGIVRIVEQGERAGEIINRLREFMRSGESQQTTVEVLEVIEAAAALAQVEATQNGVVITERLDENLPSILVDRIQIEQVLLNLLRNATEALVASNCERREIIVNARRTDEDAIEITVADTGPGIAADIEPRLFHPFVTTKDHGMGLGLSISRSIIEAHGGSLRLIPGTTGAMLAMTLPITDAEVREHG
jgi:two-component system sensor kinase FixL